jgi:hypothetical protein
MPSQRTRRIAVSVIGVLIFAFVLLLVLSGEQETPKPGWRISYNSSWKVGLSSVEYRFTNKPSIHETAYHLGPIKVVKRE